MKRPDLIVFLHIPKTAGSTLHSVVNRQFPKKAMYLAGKFNKHYELANVPEEERFRYKLIGGHVSYGIHKLFPNHSSEYFTLLREPIDRTISHYYHIEREKNHPFHKEFHEHKYSLRDFLESGKVMNVDNCMVRFISGEYDRPYGECDESMLEKALYNIEHHFPLVGLNPQFDIFLLRLCERYNFHLPYYRRHRVATNRVRIADVDSKTLATLQHYNKFDSELYRIMEERIKKEQEALPEKFYSKLARFQRMNYYAGKAISLIRRNKV